MCVTIKHLLIGLDVINDVDLLTALIANKATRCFFLMSKSVGFFSSEYSPGCQTMNGCPWPSFLHLKY